jgi:hypothetical protein
VCAETWLKRCDIAALAVGSDCMAMHNTKASHVFESVPHCRVVALCSAISDVGLILTKCVENVCDLAAVIGPIAQHAEAKNFIRAFVLKHMCAMR